MSIKLNTASDLQRFLKIVAEEAVKKSKEDLDSSSTDPYTNQYRHRYDLDKKFYNLKEQDVQSSKEQSEADEQFDDNQPEQSQEKEPERSSSKTFGASFDSLIRAINKLRSGKSTKDSVIRDQAAVYYERLSEPERNTLVLFMKEMANILTGDLEGADAQEPDADPLNITIDQEEGSADVEVEEKPEKEKSSEEPQPAAEETEVADQEDDSPPIKVNESQDIRKLREKVRNLMRS